MKNKIKKKEKGGREKYKLEKISREKTQAKIILMSALHTCMSLLKSPIHILKTL